MLTIYKASAGSGKTFQLALHYLKMVLGVKAPSDNRWRLNPQLLTDMPSVAHRRILAITFTNKATEEMKSRIIASLDAVAHATTPLDHDYIPMLMDEFGCTFDDLQGAAGRALVSVLLDFSFFNVSTIDAFFQTVLRTFARELGIQGDYNIQISAADAIRDALNLLLDSLNIADSRKYPDKRMARIRTWLEGRAGNAKGKFNPFKRTSSDFTGLVREIEKIFTEDFKPLQAELVEYLDDARPLAEFRRALEGMLESAVAELPAIGLKARGAIEASGQTGIKATVRTYIDNLCDGKVDMAAKRLPAAFARHIQGDITGELKMNKGSVACPAYIQALSDLAAECTELYGRFRTVSLLLSKVPHLEFISLMLQYLDEVRDDQNMLILDDTTSHISRIIGGSEIPFIYEHLGNRLDHFLIDEFQDTSRLQWKNLLPLVSNSHADGADSLIIGDVKQAIYRFRNSDASILGRDLETVDFPDHEMVLLRGNTRSDNCNFRTAHGIVRFNNTILPTLAEIALGVPNPPGFMGDEVRQMCSANRADLSACIEVLPFAVDDVQGRVDAIIDNILRQHDEGGYLWRDIALLYRSGSNIKELVKALLDRRIPLQSAESLYIKNTPSVRLLVALLNMLAKAGLPTPGAGDDESVKAQPGESTPEATADTPEKKEYIDPVLFEARYNFFTYQAGLEPREAIDKALEAATGVLEDDAPDNEMARTLDQAIRAIQRKHPATLVATIEAILAAELVPPATVKAEKDYIAAFTDLALDYSEHTDNDLNGFLSWWEQHQNKATIIPPADCDAVQLLTIHRAKGLEFDCVHLVDFDWKLVDDRESAWIDIRPTDPAKATPGSFGIDIGLPVDRAIIPPLMCFDLSASQIGYPGSPFRDFLDAQQMLMRTDALNIAYVGLTRARTRLSVYYDPDAQDTIGSALAETLDRVVAESADTVDTIAITEEVYDAETRTLSMYVEPTAPLTPEKLAERAAKEEAKKAREEANRAKAESYSTDYTSVVRADMIALVTVEALDPRDEARDTDDPADDDPESRAEATTVDAVEAAIRRRKRQKLERTQRGLDLHEILSHIETFDAARDNVDAVFDAAFAEAAESEGFVAEHRDEYRDVIAAMLANPEAARWFDPANHIDTEIPYHAPWEEGDKGDPEHLGKVRRMDRLVELSDGSIEVVDYKFTKIQDIDNINQVRGYMASMATVFPGRTIRGYLWYHDLGLIIPVSAS